MYLLQSWKESLIIFTPKNFKAFLLVIFKSTIETSNVFLCYLWWLTVLDFGLPIVLKLGVLSKFGETLFTLWIVILHTLTRGIIVSFLILVARTSTDKKSYTYFKYYGYYIIMIILVSVLICTPVVYLMGNHIVNFLFYRGGAVSLPVIFDAIGISFLLFWFDSKGNIKSLFNTFVCTVKMVLYNLPFYLIATALLFCFLIIVLTSLTLLGMVFVQGLEQELL